MKNAFFCGFVYSRLRLSHQFSFGVSASFLGGTQTFFQIFKSGFCRSVSKPSYLTLFRPFLCRFVVSQLGLAPCVSELKIKIKLYFKIGNIYLNLNFVKEKL